MILGWARMANFFSANGLNGVAGPNKQVLEKQIKELFLNYHCFCTRKDILCFDVVLEDTDIAKGITEYVAHAAIENLVLGASRHGFISSSERLQHSRIDVSKIFTTISAATNLVFAFNTGMLPEIQVLSDMVSIGLQLPQSRRYSLIINARKDADCNFGIMGLLETSPYLETLVVHCREPSKSFLTNTRGYPFLSKRHQRLSTAANVYDDDWYIKIF